MKNTIKLLGLSIIALAIVSCSSKKEEKTTNVEEIYTVKIKPIEMKELDKTIDVNASVESWIKVHLVPASPGKIERILVDVGSAVKEGDLIAEMDQTQYQTTKLQLQQLEKDYRRMDSLQKIGAISKQQFEQFKTNYDVTKNSYQFVEKNVFLKSPIAGIVTAKYYNDGEMFSAAPNTKDGKAALVTIEQISKLKAMVDLPETYYPNIKENIPVKMTFGVFPNDTFKASIYKIYPSIDPTTKTFRVEIMIPNEKLKLKPGMFAVAHISLGKIKSLVVPSIAIQKLQGTAKYYVFKNENNVAKQIFVQRDEIQNEFTFISSNELKEGDQIIVVGQEKLVDGSKLNIVE